jgi:hypothetical protein
MFDKEALPPVVVKVVVLPQVGLGSKEWQVEVCHDASVGEMKDAIKGKYHIDPAWQKISVTESFNPQDQGVKDHMQVAALQDDPQAKATKKVWLAPSEGHESHFTAAVMEPRPGTPFSDVPTKASTGSGKSFFTRITNSEIWSDIQKQRSQGTVQNSEKRRFTEQIWFNALTSFICLLNMVATQLEADYSCWGVRGWPKCDRGSWYSYEIIFTICFLFEVIARLANAGPVLYFMGDALEHPSNLHLGNCLDFVIVGARLIGSFLLANADVDYSVIKIVSAFRIIQVFRVALALRMVRNLRELCLVISGMGEMFKTVVWVMLLLVILFWSFGILVTLSIGQSNEQFDYSTSAWSKEEYFGTVPKSVFSLFQIMTLDKWSSSLIRPVFDKRPWIFLIIVPFLCVTTLGLLNIIVGVIVETTLTSASKDEESQAKEMQKMHARVMESLKQVFDEADTDAGGMLDRGELQMAMKKPHVRDRLKLLDIPVKDLDALFDTLDETGTGEIKTDTFFRGCSRLRGPALACDTHRMSVDFGRYISWTDDLVSLSKATNDKLEALLNDIEGYDRDVCKADVDLVDPVLAARRERSKKRGTKKGRIERRFGGLVDENSGEDSPPTLSPKAAPRPSLVMQSMQSSLGNLADDLSKRRSSLMSNRRRSIMDVKQQQDGGVARPRRVSQFKASNKRQVDMSETDAQGW